MNRPIRSRRTPYPAACVAALVLLAPQVGGAAILKVGPGGDYPSVQAAVDAALATPQADEIRLRAKVFRENVTIVATNETLRITGGWNAAFTRAPAAARTTLDAGGSGRAVVGVVSGGSLTLERLRIRGGQAAESGAGLRFDVANGGSLEILDSVVTGNSAVVDAGWLEGGGGFVQLGEGGRFVARRVTFSRNAVKTGGSGGGVGLSVADLFGVASSSATIASCQFLDNDLTIGGVPNVASGAGLLVTSGAMRLEVVDSLIQRNRLWSEVIGYGIGMALYPAGTSVVEARRNRVLDQTAPATSNASQVAFFARDLAQVRFSDSEVGRSALHGVSASAEGGRPTVRLVNLTVADNGYFGVALGATAPAIATLANSIVSGHDIDLQELRNVRVLNTLVGAADPKFVNRASADYRLLPNSPARNRGRANPPGGLGPLDVAGRPRVRGGVVDQGANEIQ
jgi:hypothetical protein